MVPASLPFTDATPFTVPVTVTIPVFAVISLWSGGHYPVGGAVISKPSVKPSVARIMICEDGLNTWLDTTMQKGLQLWCIARNI